MRYCRACHFTGADSPGAATRLKTNLLNSWPTTVAAAKVVQEALRGRVIASDKLGKVHTVAGIDVGFERDGAVTRAAVVVLEFPSLELRAQAVARAPADGYTLLWGSTNVIAIVPHIAQALHSIEHQMISRRP